MGSSNPTVNALGTLRYTGTTSTARTFNLIDGTFEAPTGVTLTLTGATVGGGFLRGAGTFALTGDTALIGVSTASSTTINQTGPATVTSYSNGGTFSVAAGQILTSNGVTNTSSGQMTVNGTANVSDFVSNGQVNIPNGGVLNNSGSPLVLGGGSRTYIGSAAVPGGAINLGGQTLELNGALLVNDGTVTGTTNVNYGSLAMGSGTYGVVNVNTGGVYAPGSSPGISTAAALTFDNTPNLIGAPTLAIELGGTAPGTQYDQVHVTGNLSLSGTLAVSLIDDFVPVAGQAFDILDWGTLSGTFASINLPTLAGLSWNTSQLYTNGELSLAAAGLPGDYNGNGTVDAADYVLWRNGGPLANEVDNPGTVNAQDYTEWRARFGNSVGSSGGANVNATVPEPATLFLLTLATAGGCLRRGRAAWKVPASR